MTQDTKKTDGGETSEALPARRKTREELIEELKRFPLDRQLVIVKVAQLVVAEKRLEMAIRNGTATRN